MRYKVPDDMPIFQLLRQDDRISSRVHSTRRGLLISIKKQGAAAVVGFGSRQMPGYQSQAIDSWCAGDPLGRALAIFLLKSCPAASAPQAELPGLRAHKNPISGKPGTGAHFVSFNLPNSLICAAASSDRNCIVSNWRSHQTNMSHGRDALQPTGH